MPVASVVLLEVLVLVVEVAFAVVFFPLPTDLEGLVPGFADETVVVLTFDLAGVFLVEEDFVFEAAAAFPAVADFGDVVFLAVADFVAVVFLAVVDLAAVFLGANFFAVAVDFRAVAFLVLADEVDFGRVVVFFLVFVAATFLSDLGAVFCGAGLFFSTSGSSPSRFLM